MQDFRFDWRWIGVIVIFALLASSTIIPWQLLVVGLAAAGSYLIYMAWQVWQRDGGGGGKREVYWRGERIELPEQRSTSLSTRTIVPIALYSVLGGALWLAAVGVILNQVGA